MERMEAPNITREDNKTCGWTRLHRGTAQHTTYTKGNILNNSGIKSSTCMDNPTVTTPTFNCFRSRGLVVSARVVLNRDARMNENVEVTYTQD